MMALLEDDQGRASMVPVWLSGLITKEMEKMQPVVFLDPTTLPSESGSLKTSDDLSVYCEEILLWWFRRCQYAFTGTKAAP